MEEEAVMRDGCYHHASHRIQVFVQRYECFCATVFFNILVLLIVTFQRDQRVKIFCEHFGNYNILLKGGY